WMTGGPYSLNRSAPLRSPIYRRRVDRPGSKAGPLRDGYRWQTTSDLWSLPRLSRRYRRSMAVAANTLRWREAVLHRITWAPRNLPSLPSGIAFIWRLWGRPGGPISSIEVVPKDFSRSSTITRLPFPISGGTNNLSAPGTLAPTIGSL